MSGRKTGKMDLKARATTIYNKANQLSGGVLDIARQTIQRFGEARGSEAAASMAYYALFSLFPLMLALVAGGSYLLDRQQVFQQVVDMVSSGWIIIFGAHLSAAVARHTSEGPLPRQMA